ncbi:DUF1566 domain-containing protein [Massilia agilis]|uniref:DUF1566 domain-containing protein n=1 Tax=Massilia agilis TaxID=1811226 RepID=A0ABT2D9D4_9BURK|nr:DUF1566 domain-containing protein [Massilia agilis]MCS0807907.1 DUF1566 domain-containing protein [Massilia agilis]
MGNHAEVKERLNEGELYAGLILGRQGEPDHHLVLLPGGASDVSWPAAQDWAASQGGSLPTRRELALLFANLREQFDRGWYWSSEQHETRAQLVWGQNFASGIQTVYGRPFRGNARAVRRIQIG